MSKRLVSRAELARIAGVSRAAITKACKGQLRPALDGKAVDLGHEATELYLAGRGVKVPPAEAPKAPSQASSDRSDHAPTDGADPKPKRGSKPSAPRLKREKRAESPPPHRRRQAPKEPPPELDEEDSDEDELGAVEQDDDIEGYAHLTLDQIVKRFGRRPEFRFWLDARKKIADIREKELKNDETIGRLIERDLVKTHLFGAIEEVHRRLLGDTPKTIARELFALAKSGQTVEDAEERVRKILSSQLVPVKTKAAKVLRNA